MDPDLTPNGWSPEDWARAFRGQALEKSKVVYVDPRSAIAHEITRDLRCPKCGGRVAEDPTADGDMYTCYRISQTEDPCATRFYIDRL